MKVVVSAFDPKSFCLSPKNLFSSRDYTHCKWKKMDGMKVMIVFIRIMLADESYVPVNESYLYKMAFGLYAWKQT